MTEKAAAVARAKVLAMLALVLVTAADFAPVVDFVSA